MTATSVNAPPAGKQTTGVPCRHCGTPNAASELFCNQCGKMALSVGRLTIVLFLVSGFFGVYLFRLTGFEWPAYAIASVLLLSFYGSSFSRGRAAPFGAISVAVITAVWGAYAIAEQEPNQASLESMFESIRSMTTTVADAYIEYNEAILTAMVLIATISGIAVGRSTMFQELRSGLSYYFGLIAFMFAFWAFMILTAANGSDLDGLFQYSLLGALALPLVVLIYLLWSGRHLYAATSTAPAVALWSLVMSAYLVPAQFLVDSVEFVLGSFVPRMVGESPTDVELPLIIRILRWRSPLVAALFATTFISMLSSSVVAALRDFRARESTAGRQSLGAELNRVLYNIATFSFSVARALALELFDVLKHALRYVLLMFRLLVIPIALTSIVSISLFIALRNMSAYVNETPDRRSVLTILGELGTVGVLAIGVGGIAMILIASEVRQYVTGAAWINLALSIGSLLAVGAVLLLAPLVYWSLRGVDIEVSELKPGPLVILFWAACLLVVVSGSIGSWGAAAAPSQSGNGSSVRLLRENAIPSIVVGLLALASLVVGGLPLLDQILNAGQG